MPILLSSTLRRALGAVAFVASIAVSLWLFSADNSIKKKKKKELEFKDSVAVNQEVEKDNVTFAEEKVLKEVTFGEVVEMEVLMPASDELDSSSNNMEVCKDEEEILNEDSDDDKPASRYWTELVEEELEEEEAKELEMSLTTQLTFTQPQNVVSHTNFND